MSPYTLLRCKDRAGALYDIEHKEIFGGGSMVYKPFSAILSKTKEYNQSFTHSLKHLLSTFFYDVLCTVSSQGLHWLLEETEVNV